MGLSLSSFYYYFFLESITLILVLLLNYKLSLIKNIIKNIKYYIILVFSFFISSFPFLINLYFHEKEFTYRQCVYGLTLENKEILLKFYLNQFSEIGFLLIFFSIILSSIWLNFTNNKNKLLINVLCILFVSSILNPLIFTVISNKACVFYHFNNLIIISGLLYFIFFFLIYLQRVLMLFNLVKFNKIVNFSLIAFLCFTFYLTSLNNSKNTEFKNLREEFNIISTKIKNTDDIKDISILLLTLIL